MPIREPLESCENSPSVNSGCTNGPFNVIRESVGSNPPQAAMAKDDGYDESPMDDLAVSMRNSLKLKTSAPSTSSCFSKKHRLSPYSMQENQQNRCKSSCTSSDGSFSNGYQYPSSAEDPGQAYEDVSDVGTCRLLREGSLIKEAVKRLQSKRRHVPF